jgi:hypothetical protein
VRASIIAFFSIIHLFGRRASVLPSRRISPAQFLCAAPPPLPRSASWCMGPAASFPPPPPLESSLPPYPPRSVSVAFSPRFWILLTPSPVAFITVRGSRPCARDLGALSVLPVLRAWSLPAELVARVPFPCIPAELMARVAADRISVPWRSFYFSTGRIWVQCAPFPCSARFVARVNFLLSPSLPAIWFLLLSTYYLVFVAGCLYDFLLERHHLTSPPKGGAALTVVSESGSRV